VSDEAWVVTLLGVLTLWAMVATVCWLRERAEARDWMRVAITLGNEYDRMLVEQSRADQERTWLN
jgi:hypothetical protein